MARGWGKSAEDVEQEAEERAQQRAAPRLDDSPAARERRERLAALQLSRARTLEQLERATNPAHREMLRRTLEQLERATNPAHREMLRRTLRSLETQLEELDGEGRDRA